VRVHRVERTIALLAAIFGHLILNPPLGNNLEAVLFGLRFSILLVLLSVSLAVRALCVHIFRQFHAIVGAHVLLRLPAPVLVHHVERPIALAALFGHLILNPRLGNSLEAVFFPVLVSVSLAVRALCVHAFGQIHAIVGAHALLRVPTSVRVHLVEWTIALAAQCGHALNLPFCHIREVELLAHRLTILRKSFCEGFAICALVGSLLDQVLAILRAKSI